MSDFEHLDYYELLGIPRTASLDEIKRAYRREISKFHPDRFVNGSPAEQAYAILRSQRLTEAYGTLSDLAARSAYNRGQSPATRTARPAAPSQPRDHQAELYDQAIGHLNAGRPLQAIGALRQLQQINPFYRNSAELLGAAESQLTRQPARPARRARWPLIVTGGVLGGVAIIALVTWAIGLRGATASRGATATSAALVAAAPTLAPTPTFAPVEPTAAPTVQPTAASTVEPTAVAAATAAPVDVPPTAAPTATPAGEQGTLLFNDHFASGGWANINSRSWRVGYQRGRYAVRGEAGTGAIWSYRTAPASDVSVGVDVQVAAGEGGLLVRFLDANNYVSITLNPGQTSFRVEQHSGGGTNVLAGGQSEAIAPGADAHNRLVARLRGDHVEVLVNGQSLAAIDASGAPDSARYGLLVIAKDSASEAYFDNLEIRGLDN